MNLFHPTHTRAAFVGSFLATAIAAQASVLVQEDFSYSDGALLGQGGWTITGTSTLNPLTVSSGAVTLATTGQDAYKALPSAVNLATNGGIYFAMDIKVASAQATGDYFFHLSDPVATTSNFYSRLLVRSSGSGFTLGLQEQSGTGATPTYGTTELSFATQYKVVVAWTSVPSGTNNDILNLYVNPTSLVQGSNLPYATDAWTTSTVEPLNITAFNLRQGTAANAPVLTVDNIVIATSFASAIPEPAAFATLAGLVVLGGAASRRRRA